MTQQFPPVGFHFQVKIDNESFSFQEVSGISSDINTEEISEGGENRFIHKVPTHIKYNNLELKRGLISKDSSFYSWVTTTMDSGFSSSIIPKTVEITLLNEEGIAVMTWNFINAWPVGWNIGGLNSMTNEVLIESITLSYNYFTTQVIQ